jgi:O-antigen/teichoic acid export membrane protein
LLGALLRGASAFTLALQILRYAVNLGVSMLLARLIAPEDFGLNGMAMVFLGVMIIFKDAGMETAMIARKELSQEDLARMATFSLGFGCLLMLVCAALAPLLAWLYGAPALCAPVLVMSLVFPLHGLAVQPGVKLLREGRFRTYAAIDFSGIVIGLLCALFLAWKGAGLWALFSVEMAYGLFVLVGFWFASGWKARFRTDWKKAEFILGQGRNLSLVRILGHSARNIDQLVLGLCLGPSPAAFYGKAYKLVGFTQEAINWPLSRLAISALGKERNNPRAFVSAYKRYNLLSAALGMPLVVFLVIAAKEIVAVLYGPQWTDSVPLLRALGLLGWVNTFLLGASWVYSAWGSTRRQLGWELFNFACLAVAFMVGVRWGALGLAVAASAVYAGLRIPSLLYCFRGTPLQLGHLGEALARPALASGLASVAGIMTHLLFSQNLCPLGSLATDAASVFFGYLLGWIIIPGWKHCLSELSEESC